MIAAVKVVIRKWIRNAQITLSQAIQQNTTLFELVSMICSSLFNWFELNCRLEEQNIDHTFAEIKIEALLEELIPEERTLTVLSHKVFLHIEDKVMPEQEREASAWNGNVVPESEHEDPDSFLGQDHKAALRTIITYMRRKAHKAKAVAERRFLASRRSKKVTGILKTFPGIGKEIESFVQERSVGLAPHRCAHF